MIPAVKVIATVLDTNQVTALNTSFHIVYSYDRIVVNMWKIACFELHFHLLN